MVRLRLGVNPLLSDFCDFFCGCKKKSFGPKHCFNPFLLGQNFHIFLRSGLRGLTPPPLLTVLLTVRYPCFFTTFLNHWTQFVGYGRNGTNNISQEEQSRGYFS